MKENKACKESYPWFRKQKNKDWQSLSNQLYKEQYFDWCFWLLYRKTTIAKIYLWFLFTLSLILSGISFLISTTSIGNSFSDVVIIAFIVAATAFFIIFVVAVDAAAADVFAFIAAVADVFAFIAVIAAVANVFAFIAVFVFAVFIVIGFIIIESKVFSKIGCKLFMREYK